MTTNLPISPILQDKLEDLLDRAIAMHRTDMGHIQLFNHHTNSLFISTQRGFTSDCLNYLRTVSINNTANSKPLIVEDVATDPLHLTHLDIAKVAGYRAFQSTPLIGRRGKLVGVLSTHFRQPRKFLPWEINLINLHAGHIADLIEVFQT